MDPKVIKEKLIDRVRSNSLRELKDHSRFTDFCSNDYLGFAKDSSIWEGANNLLKLNSLNINGSSGSRLLSGNRSFIENIENQIAKFHSAEAGILFNSGFDANTGLLGSVIQRDDVVICDSLIHASLIDGIRLSKAKRLVFEHNNLESLVQKLEFATGSNIFIVVESVYSMDGDFCKLSEIVQIAKKYKAFIIVDEAHATGVVGKKGEGLVSILGLENEIFARVHTFGKAIGCHGAIVLGSKDLRDFLINFARPLIYSTFMPYHSIFCLKLVYDNLTKSNDKVLLINSKIQLFKALVDKKLNLINSLTPIQGLLIKGNENCKMKADFLQKAGFDVRPILSPTVLEGKERIRICLHTFNTDSEIKLLCKAINTLNE